MKKLTVRFTIPAPIPRGVRGGLEAQLAMMVHTAGNRTHRTVSVVPKVARLSPHCQERRERSKMFNGYCYDGHLREFTNSRSTNADGKNKNYYNVCPPDEVATAAEQDL